MILRALARRLDRSPRTQKIVCTAVMVAVCTVTATGLMALWVGLYLLADLLAGLVY